MPGAVTAVGVEAVRRYLERFAAHWSEGEWRPEEFQESGDRVFNRARLRVRGRRSGIEVDLPWTYVVTVKQGKLFRQEGFDERVAGLRAARIDPPKDAGPLTPPLPLCASSDTLEPGVRHSMPQE